MSIIQFVKKAWGNILTRLYHHRFKNIMKSSRVHHTASIYNPDNLYMEDNTNIDGGAIVMNGRAKLIIKKNSGAAVDLLAITGNHMSVVGKNLKQVTEALKEEMDINHEMDKDIVVDEDVWIGARVTLLSGAHLGRGCEIGSNSVVRGKVPPYSVVIGNPCKVVGFRFSPQEIIEHEKQQYSVEDRLPLDLLEKNYENYFVNRIKDIKQFTKL